MGSAYSIKIHKPIHLQTNGNIIQNSDLKSGQIMTSYIRRSRNYDIIPFTKKTYKLLILFIPKTKVLMDYDEISTTLASRNVIVSVCRFSINDSFKVDKVNFIRMIEEIMTRIVHDFMINNKLHISFSELILIGHSVMCDVLNRLATINPTINPTINSTINSTINIKFRIVLLDPPSINVPDTTRIIKLDKVHPDTKIHNDIYSSLITTDLELVSAISAVNDKIASLILVDDTK